MIRWRLLKGTSITRDGTTVTPLARSLTVGWPGGGLAWVWPAGVMLQREGSRTRVASVDVTRVLQLAIAGAGMLMALRIITQRRTSENG
jgi:hypothetical protein